MRLSRLAPCAVLLAAVSALAAPLGTAITYQGRLANGGVAISGQADMRFTLWTDAENGFAIGPTLDFSGASAVTVAGGLFTVELPFDAGVFDGMDVFLEIEVRSPAGVGAYQTLTPRQRISPTPYAVQTRGLFVDAQLNVGVGTTSPTSKLHIDGDVTTTGTSRIRMFHQSNPGTPSVLIDGDYFNGSAVQLAESDGTVRILQRGDIGQISVNDGEAGQPRVIVEGGATQTEGGTISVRNGISIPTVFVDGDPDGGADGGLVELRNGSGAVNETTISLEGSTGTLRLLRSLEPASILVAASYGGALFTYDEAGTLAARMGTATDSGGILELYQADSGIVGATLDGDSAGAGRLQLRNATGVITADLDADAINDGGRLTLRDSGNSTIILADAETKALTLRDGTQETIRLSGEGAGGGGGMNLINSLGTATVEIDADDEDDHAAIRLFREGAVNATISILTAETPSTGATLIMRNAAGEPTIELDADFNGLGRVITEELQITGGSDLSEQFDIAHPQQQDIEPGMVVAIDPANPGKLVVTAKAYDRTVAGIISGAGGVKPGMYMGQKGTAADGRHPVALTGRVYCYVDASHGAIQPGDLLTTSDTPGHAMKVADPARAQGAIIGKAMTGLESGRGLVMVLVSLQ